MSKNIRYSGNADVRTLTASDFTAAGLTHGDISWSKSNQWIVNVPDDIALYCLGQGGFVDNDSGLLFNTFIHSRVGDNGLTTPADWGQYVMPALAGAAAVRADVVVFGDSISQGIGSSVPWDKGWVGLLGTALQAKFGDGGSGFCGVVDSPAGQGFSNPTRPTQSGTWIALAGDFGVGGYIVYSGSAGAYTEWTNIRGRRIRVYYNTAAAAGNFEVRVNGVLVQTIAPPSANGMNFYEYDRGVGNEGACTVRVTAVSSAVVYLCGIAGFNDHGVCIWNMSKWGRTSAMALAAAYTGAASPNLVGQKSITDIAPVLFIYCMGGNDQGTAVDAETTFRSNMRFAINCAVGSTKNGAVDMILVADHIAHNDDIANNWHKYVKEVANMANCVGAAFMNHWARGSGFNNYMDLKGYSTAALNIHPGDAGHAWMAAPIKALLGV